MAQLVNCLFVSKKLAISLMCVESAISAFCKITQLGVTLGEENLTRLWEGN